MGVTGDCLEKQANKKEILVGENRERQRHLCNILTSQSLVKGRLRGVPKIKIILNLAWTSSRWRKSDVYSFVNN